MSVLYEMAHRDSLIKVIYSVVSSNSVNGWWLSRLATIIQRQAVMLNNSREIHLNVVKKLNSSKTEQKTLQG